MCEFVSLDYLRRKGHYWKEESTDTYAMDAKILENIPEEEIIETQEAYGVICKNCGRLIFSNYFNFCPACGAPFVENKNNNVE